MCLWPLRSWRACPRSRETDSRDSVLPTFHMTLRCFVLAHWSSLFFEVTEKFIVGNSENKIALLIFYLQTGTWAVVMPIAPDVWHEDTTDLHSQLISFRQSVASTFLPSFICVSSPSQYIIVLLGNLPSHDQSRSAMMAVCPQRSFLLPPRHF